MPEFVVSLSDTTPSLELLGGKAASLVRLAARTPRFRAASC